MYASTGVGRRLTPVAAVALLVMIGTVTLAVVDPEQPGHYPLCPLRALTGLYCPGCGSLRAVHALAHGQVSLAMHRNLLLVVTLPALGAAYLAWAWRRLLDRPPRWTPSTRFCLCCAVVVVGFGVLRNLPVGAGLAP